VSHDQVTRFLSGQDFTSKDLWPQVKSVVRSIESSGGVLIFDDTSQEKAWTDENELMCWHYDHVSGRNVRGINLLNALYHSNGASIPVAFELVKNPIQYCDLVTRQLKRRSDVTKNELMRQMIETCIRNELKFHFVLMDSWFSATENFEFIAGKGRHFIAALKDNRLIAVTEEGRNKGRFVRVEELNIPEQTAVRGWLKGYAKEVLVLRQVFTNKDGSTGRLHLVCSDLTCDYDAISTTYKKWWEVGVSSQGHINQSVQVRPGLTDSRPVAWEASWSESKTMKPSDNMLRKEYAQLTRLQRAVNADVASLHENPEAETVYNVRKQQEPIEMSPMRRLSPAGYQRRHGEKENVATGEALGVRRRNLVEEATAITVSGKCKRRRQGGGSGRTTVDGRAAKRVRREGPGPVSIPLDKVRQG